MLNRQGMTLMEIIVVLVIVGIAAVLFSPNFLSPNERARAANVRNNLLSIYTAEQNYINNNNTTAYCINTTGCDSLANINNTLSLSIQDDGTYSYRCAKGVSGLYTCAATRTSPASAVVMTVTLSSAIKLDGTNPTCTSLTGDASWCP